ncbi:hypothetical protein PoB_005096200 [Plakobranchus ocellatus]|uniref:Uncharacterized protein n=1 Tax=Plakobranchus ocellatus TaxID=259542 RepID=A0AAV4BZD0_9GAST|nr:hypothetical protein PoB_005096200 [Plakobranchus ocellatus]
MAASLWLWTWKVLAVTWSCVTPHGPLPTGPRDATVSKLPQALERVTSHLGVSVIIIKHKDERRSASAATLPGGPITTVQKR